MTISHDHWLSSLIASIASPDPDGHYRARARARLDQLLLPHGGLGRLEDVILRLARVQQRERPAIPRKTLLIFAGDHGVTEERISAYSADVTANVCYSFIAGGGAANVLTRCAGADIRVIDVGVAHDFRGVHGIVHRKIAFGTRNLRREPAGTVEQTLQAMQAGAEAVDACTDSDIIALGEIGIGNTTASAALFSALTGIDPEISVGVGTGIGPQTRARKVAVVRDALELHRDAIQDPLHALATVGGLEISALTGAVLAAAARRKPVLVDGFITSVAALAATCLSGDVPVRDYLLASHRSPEQGHSALLEHLGIVPLLDVGLRIGEGTGAALAFPIIDAACTLVSQIHTFEEAGIQIPPVSPERL